MNYTPTNLHKQPANNLYWIHNPQVQKNTWNPNRVAPPEMELLKHSIIRNGWLFPILLIKSTDDPIRTVGDSNIVAPDQHFVIIDGFHRFTVSKHPDIYALTNGYIPCVFLPPADVLMVTVHMNRAKGEHGVVEMSTIVKQLIQSGKSVEDIMEGMGMDKDEVLRLANQQGITKDQIFNSKGFSDSWSPV